MISFTTGLRCMQPYYHRATEVEGTSTEGTVVAFYCRSQAMQKAIAGKLGAEDKVQLIQLMDALEDDKAKVREQTFEVSKHFVYSAVCLF